MPKKSSHSDIVETVFLIPLRFNDKSRVPIEYFDGLEDALFCEFGGFNVEGRVEGKPASSSIKGTYRMQDGTKAHDEVFKYFVALQLNDIQKLRKMLQRCADDLDQESIYFAITGARVEFVEKTPDGKQ